AGNAKNAIKKDFSLSEQFPTNFPWTFLRSFSHPRRTLDPAGLLYPPLSAYP
ncbi:hypothetical protein GWI33_002734, partial [Rhynchophorus ferrugineus]